MYYDYYDVSPYARSLDGVSASGAYGLAAIVASFLGFILIVCTVIGVLQIVAMWKVYAKAGEKGWKAIIPIYNLVILFKISGLSPWLVLVYLIGWVPFIGWLAILALSIYQANSLAKSFGKDVGYTVGLFFLPTIFYLILGLGSSKYVGPGGMKEETVRTEPTSTPDPVVEVKKVEESKTNSEEEK